MKSGSRAGVEYDYGSGKRMTEEEQIYHFGEEIDRLVNRFREEYDVSYAGIIGALQMKAYLLCEEAAERKEEGGGNGGEKP